ncbi:hypothetical protein ACV1C6_10885, partial [Aeromonas sanarellii]
LHTLRGGQNWTLKTPETWSFLRADQQNSVKHFFGTILINDGFRNHYVYINNRSGLDLTP